MAVDDGPYVVGIYIGHDASIAVAGGGKIIHYELERWTRKRHDGGEIRQLYNDALHAAGIEDSDVTALVGASGALGSCCDFWTDQNVVGIGSPQNYGGIEHPVYYVPHHTAHLAYAFYTSPYETARLVALDGGGDAYKPPFWSILCTDCAVGIGSHSFGSESSFFRAEWVPNCYVGGFWISSSKEIFGAEYAEGKCMALLGVPEDDYVRITGFPIESLHEMQRLQELTTATFHRLVNNDIPEPGPVALAGGCALNGIAAYALLQRSDVTAVHVPPAVDDGGVPVGAALLVLHHILKAPRVRYSHETVAFAGYTEDALNGEPPADIIAEALASGKVVALAHGRAESGPRALGHRSLLADPRTLASKDKLNRIKGREPWRPVAPVVLAEYADQYFKLINPDCYHFMTTIADTTERARTEIPAGVHFDGSARVQVVSGPSDFANILRAFRKRTGCPVVLNTSFNLKGESICNTVADARSTFDRAPEIDMLVLGSEVIERSNDDSR